MPAYEVVTQAALDTATTSQEQLQPNGAAACDYDSMSSQHAPPAADASLKQSNLTAVYDGSNVPTGSVVLDDAEAETDDDYSLMIDAGIVDSGTSASPDGVYSTATDVAEDTVPRRPPRTVAHCNDTLPRLPANTAGPGRRRSVYNGFGDAEDV